MDRIAIVREFLSLIDEAHKADDPTIARKRIGEILADDLVYQNRPQRPVHGKEGLASFQQELAGVWWMKCHIIRAAVDGDWVLTERRDAWSIGEIEVSTPLMGSFEVREDGKIHSWIDYLPYIEQWKESGQMRPGFFEDWANEEDLVRKVDAPGS